MSEAVNRLFGAAALVIALIAAPGAHAQLLKAQPVLQAAPAGPELLLTPREPPVRDSLFHQRSGIGFSTRTFSQQDGGTATQRGLIGSVAIANGLEAGVGLFAIAGDRRKINETRRNWSMKDVTPKTENIAAVGMRLRF